MTRYPVDIRVRTRLIEAQRAETQALRKVSAADAAVGKVRARLDEADQRLARAQQELVDVSGLARAAQLVGVREKDLRRRLREADVAVARSTSSDGDDSASRLPQG